MKTGAYEISSWDTMRLDPLRSRPDTRLVKADEDAGFSQISIKDTFRPLRFFNKKLHRIKTLISKDELKSVLATSGDALPKEANYKSGDIIHASIGRSIHQKLKIYGATTGGYSVVYTVLDDDTLEPYCLKSPRGPLADDSDVDRIAREARTWISLGRHPNIVHAHSLFEINGCISILLEYVAGQNLSSRLKQSPLRIREVLNYAIQLCRALEYAQSKVPGFIHGDIKPANCLLTADGVVKLTDFGQVRSFTISESNSLDQIPEKTDAPPRNWAAGTPPYMAPEQFDASGKTDIRADIYSFGVTLFEMLAGQKPFIGHSHDECFQQHQNVAPPEVRSLNAEVPERLSDLVMSCLSKSPSDRPSDFAAVGKELATILLENFHETIPPVVPEAVTEEELINRSASLIVLGLYDEAVEWLSQALLINPKSAVAWTLKGKAVSLMGSPDEALACFRRSLALDPSWPFAWSEASEVFTQLGNYGAALRCSDRAITLKKKTPSFWSTRGRILALAKRFQPALECLKRAIDLDSYCSHVLLRLGALQFEQGQMEEAVAYLKRAIGLNPLCLDVQCSLADAYSRLGFFEETIELCREGLASRPGCAELRSRLNVAYRDLYAKSRQLSDTERTQSLDGFLVDIHESGFVLTRCLFFMAASEYDPLAFYICAFELHNSAKALRRSEKKGLLDALESVSARLSISGADRKTYYWLGRLYYRLGRYDECMETFKQSSEGLGPDEKAFYYLAACHEISERYEQALSNYKQAFIFEPKCQVIRNAIRRVETCIAGDAERRVNLADLAYQT
jgi:serine/threonine protein kinase